MARLIRIGAVAIVLALACWSLWPAKMPVSSGSDPVASKTNDAVMPGVASAPAVMTARQRYAQSLMAFEPNQGQTDPAVKYFARGAGYTLFLTPTEAVFRLRASATQETQHPGRIDPIASHRVEPTAVVRMSLVGASVAPTLVGQDKQPGVSNYFLGENAAKWRRDVPHYGQVQYNAVYPGVDLVYYGNQQQLEYDFLVAPGADPTRITLAYAGVDNLRLDPNGNLVLGAGKGELVQHRPVAYQEIAGQPKSVEADYTLFANHRVGIRLGAYDHREPLVIDPVLAYGTYWGASGEDGTGFIAVDRAGNMYLAGSTESTDFPLAGAYQGTNAGGIADVFVSKINAAGSALVYSTYLGGGGWDSPVGFAVDGAGRAVVSGQSSSTDFPHTVGALKTTSNGSDLFVTKLNPAGNDLIYSTYLGGSSNAELGGALALDGSSNAYIVGTTYSDDFPMVGAIQSTPTGIPDAFVAKLNASGTALIYSTYLGGLGDDSATGIALDTNGNAYVAGFTASSTTFPRVAARQNTYGGGAHDGFLSKINSTGTALVYSTFHGGSADDFINAVAVDADGNAFVAGDTGSSSDFPRVAARQGTYGNGTSDAFLSKFDADGSALLFSTFHGGSGYDHGYRVAVDRAGNAYLVGYTSSLTGFPLTAPLYPSYYNSYGVYLSKFRADGSALAYSTMVSASGANNDDDLRVDKQGTAWVAAKARYSYYQTVMPLQANCSAGCSGPNLKEDITLSKVATPLAQPWAGDFDGDGNDDILWRNMITGANVIWKSANSATQQSVTSVISADWTVAGIGDFDGDLKADILWRNVETGQNVIWKAANSATTMTVATLADFNWRIVAVADFDGDGKADLLWRNQVTGTNSIWKSANIFAPQAMAAVNPAWDMVGAGDFNHDGKADVLWRHNSTGANVIWRSANSATTQSIAGVSDAAWRVVGVADVNGDGSADVIWRNASTGANSIWLSALNTTAQGMPPQVHAWRILGVGDYTGDGQADVLWRNTATGFNVIWKSGKNTTPQTTTGVSNTDWWPQS